MHISEYEDKVYIRAVEEERLGITDLYTYISFFLVVTLIDHFWVAGLKPLSLPDKVLLECLPFFSLLTSFSFNLRLVQ